MCLDADGKALALGGKVMWKRGGGGGGTGRDNLEGQRAGCCAEGDTELTRDSSVTALPDLHHVPRALRGGVNAEYTPDLKDGAPKMQNVELTISYTDYILR